MAQTTRHSLSHTTPPVVSTAAPQDSVPATPRHQRLLGCSDKGSQEGPGAPLAAPIWARRRIRHEHTGKHACRNGSLTPDLRRPKRRLLGSPPEDSTGAPRTRREDPLSRPPHPELAARDLPMTDTWEHEATAWAHNNPLCGETGPTWGWAHLGLGWRAAFPSSPLSAAGAAPRPAVPCRPRQPCRA